MRFRFRNNGTHIVFARLPIHQEQAGNYALRLTLQKSGMQLSQQIVIQQSRRKSFISG